MNVVYKQEYEQDKKQSYKEFLTSVSSNSTFDDMVWVCDKRNVSLGNESHKFKIHFTGTPKKHLEITKYFAILRLLGGITIKVVRLNIYALNLFFDFLDEKDLSEVNYRFASDFKEFLDKNNYADSTKLQMWSNVDIFLRKMRNFDDLNLKNPFIKNVYKVDKLVDSKYIPENIIKQLDITFMNEEIFVTHRLMYWILRLIPSRISEILGMKIDCLKPFDDHFIITIPTWKQNGGYLEPIKRIIHIEDVEIGSHLLKLIREQQRISLDCQPFLEENRKNALFTYQDGMLNNGIYYKRNRYIVATWASADYHLKKICKQYNVTDEKGEIYKVSSHQFRHNGVTDRLRAGFTLPQIAEMTAHHGTAMLYGSYAHLNLFPETLVKPIEYNTEEENPCVLFGGRILNMDAITEARLLKNLRSHRIAGGICVDVTHCESGMWDCISCKNFVPEKEQLEYFKAQVIAWNEKANNFRDNVLLHKNFVELANNFMKIVEFLEEI